MVWALSKRHVFVTHPKVQHENNLLHNSLKKSLKMVTDPLFDITKEFVILLGVKNVT